MCNQSLALCIRQPAQQTKMLQIKRRTITLVSCTSTKTSSFFVYYLQFAFTGWLQLISRFVYITSRKTYKHTQLIWKVQRCINLEELDPSARNNTQMHAHTRRRGEDFAWAEKSSLYSLCIKGLNVKNWEKQTFFVVVVCCCLLQKFFLISYAATKDSRLLQCFLKKAEEKNWFFAFVLWENVYHN